MREMKDERLLCLGFVEWMMYGWKLFCVRLDGNLSQTHCAESHRQPSCGGGTCVADRGLAPLGS